MNKVSNFYKVSFDQFMKDYGDTYLGKTSGFTSDEIRHMRDVYGNIKLPKRATIGSAGYDFYVPEDVILEPGETTKIPTGIRASMERDWVLFMVPRSGLGFKYRLQLNNTVGIIDSDYFNSDNEGHIFAKITNDTNESKTIALKAGDGFMQGIFLQYGVTENDNTNGVRNGGFGSTSK